jgi:hypothetical protein
VFLWWEDGAPGGVDGMEESGFIGFVIELHSRIREILNNMHAKIKHVFCGCKMRLKILQWDSL